MTTYGLPVLYTLFVWWFSTGAILYLDRLPARTHRWSMLATTVILVLSLYGLAISSNSTTISAAYCAFTCAVLVWGWQEMAFLRGLLTGPRCIACPRNCSEWQRFVYATQTILYQELALIVLTALIAALTWGGTNQVGLWTFVILWVMRLSAKLNLFLGARNLSEDFLPEKLRYLETYFTRRPMNLLFPVSVSAATTVAVIGWFEVFLHDANSFESASLNFLCTLLSLAVLEHWFMVLPLPSSALWKWSLKNSSKDSGAASTDADVVTKLVTLNSRT